MNTFNAIVTRPDSARGLRKGLIVEVVGHFPLGEESLDFSVESLEALSSFYRGDLKFCGTKTGKEFGLYVVLWHVLGTESAMKRKL